MPISLGPVTAHLETDLKRTLRESPGAVVWLDKDAHYSAYADALVERYRQGDFEYPVVTFRGSYLETLFALAPYTTADRGDRVLIHLPGHNPDTVRKTPLLEHYRAGKRYQRALITVIREAATGKVTPDRIDHYLKQADLTLAAGDRWLAAALAAPQDDRTAYLETCSLNFVLEGLLGIEAIGLQAPFAQGFEDTASLESLQAFLYRKTGLSPDFWAFYSAAETLTFGEIRDILLAWLMAVEYVHDLRRDPYLPLLHPLKTLAKPLREVCLQLVQYLRTTHPDHYAFHAERVEATLADEFSRISPRDLGKIDTFQREATAILDQALADLQDEQWDAALALAQTRLRTASFWISRDRQRQIEWDLVQRAATLGQRLHHQPRPLAQAQVLTDAVDIYTQGAYGVDQAHRHFEQQCLQTLDLNLPHFNPIRRVRDQLRQRYRHWLNQLNTDFNALCDREGFLPEAPLQQRTLYDQVVHPLTQGNGKVAYFLIDAWRYEMAAELLPALAGAGAQVTLQGRLAELPTITAVGMNALAPVQQGGKLMLSGQGDFNGFKTGEYTVRLPKDRARAMGERSVDNRSTGRTRTRALTLQDVGDLATRSLQKSCADAILIVVHSKEIDDAGEAGVGIASFDTWLNQIKAAWQRLKAIGVQQFVFTADHGFLLLPPGADTVPHGSKRTPQRRYVLMTEPYQAAESVTVPLSTLNYEGQSGYLLFRQDTCVFDQGKNATFVHGGNSLQERVIPVLQVSYRQAGGRIQTQYQVMAEAVRSPTNLNHLRFTLTHPPESQGVLQFASSAVIHVALRVPHRPDIQVRLKAVQGAPSRGNVIEFDPTVPGWVQVQFELVSTQPYDERVKVEIYHPDGVEQVVAAVPEAYFEAVGQSQPAPPAAPGEADAAPPTDSGAVGDRPDLDWQLALTDEGVRRVFLHLQQHNSVTEAEMVTMLGNPRKVRRFSRDFETYQALVPFRVRVESTPTGKRYVKDR